MASNSPPLAEVKGRFPHELSGGQLQRTAIARALISSPTLIVADEPVSMVDASLRMSIVNLFKNLRDELKVSIIYITHDLATAYYISDRVLIMQRGKVVEAGPAREVLSNPRHPYTILLRESILSLDDVDSAHPDSAAREDKRTAAAD
jgi:peptide/nickel transport system ATP-binding protein